mmetsp:Transcript_9663/g.13126  ORF Transcript_9663/g.13126 Transcript_9663/m.13126 type:complete len:159 (-) Transcript_9663:107-583(-)
MWHEAQEPQRGALHGILQCAVGLHHLLNNNHRGCMLEIGEGLRKLHRIQSSDDLTSFEEQMDAVLEFVYATQLEYAACSEDECVALNGDEESYKLLGDFARGENLYILEAEGGVQRLVYHPSKIKFSKAAEDPNGMIQEVQRVNTPVLRLEFKDYANM